MKVTTKNNFEAEARELIELLTEIKGDPDEDDIGWRISPIYEYANDLYEMMLLRDLSRESAEPLISVIEDLDEKIRRADELLNKIDRERLGRAFTKVYVPNAYEMLRSLIELETQHLAKIEEILNTARALLAARADEE